MCGLIMYGTIYLILELGVVNGHSRTKQALKNEEEKKIIDMIAALKGNLHVLCYPFNAVGVYRIMIETNHSPIFPYTAQGWFKEQLDSKYNMNYPFLDLSQVKRMDKDFGIDILILDRKKLNQNLPNWYPDGEWYEPTTFEHFKIYYNPVIED